MSYENLKEAAHAIGAATGRVRHEAAVVLGSGLSGFATTFDGAVEVPYSDIPHFPAPRVEGHTGSLFSVQIGGRAALLFAGRVHTYEGWDLGEVVFGVRTAATAGCHTVILTNASGGLGEGLAPGHLVAIRDHLNMTGRNPLVGDPVYGGRLALLYDTAMFLDEPRRRFLLGLWDADIESRLRRFRRLPK